jgi:hypothetical protein
MNLIYSLFIILLFIYSIILVPQTRVQSSVVCLSLDHFRRHGFRPVRCYAFFKRWLLLSQLPGCFKTMTSLTT